MGQPVPQPPKTITYHIDEFHSRGELDPMPYPNAGQVFEDELERTPRQGLLAWFRRVLTSAPTNEREKTNAL